MDLYARPAASTSLRAWRVFAFGKVPSRLDGKAQGLDYLHAQFLDCGDKVGRHGKSFFLLPFFPLNLQFYCCPRGGGGAYLLRFNVIFSDPKKENKKGLQGDIPATL